MRKLNVTVPATFAPALRDALAWAIDMARAARNADGNPPGSPYAARRDALGELFLQLAIAETRTPPVRSGKRWTREEDAFLRACWGSTRRAYSDGEAALQQLADAVQRTPVAVALRLQSLGIWH